MGTEIPGAEGDKEKGGKRHGKTNDVTADQLFCFRPRTRSTAEDGQDKKCEVQQRKNRGEGVVFYKQQINFLFGILEKKYRVKKFAVQVYVHCKMTMYIYHRKEFTIIGWVPIP